MKTKLKSIIAIAMVAVGLTATAAEPEAVQLWEGGPYWATVNVGAEKPEDYGILTNFNDAAQAVTDALGEGWRLPTKDELDNLSYTWVCTHTWTQQGGNNGFLFTNSSDSSKSIFLPAAGGDKGNGNISAGLEGYYWSSTGSGESMASVFFFTSAGGYSDSFSRTSSFSVRAVRDTPPPSPITLGEVKSHEPWDGKFDVEYTLGGLESGVDYKVVFDVTADSKSVSVTNAAAKLESKTYTNTLDTAELFGAITTDKAAQITARLIKLEPKAKPPAGQLWEGGPIWATVNVGTSEVQDHPEYGALYKFDDADAAVKSLLGQEWRLPTKEDFQNLLKDENCSKQWTQQGGVNGYLFTGKDDYSSNSIFLPAAGIDYCDGREFDGVQGYYWSSEGEDASYAWYLYFDGGNADVGNGDRSYGLSVRAVRDAK